MTLGARANVKVRAERGGDEVARAKADALKGAWPRDVVKHVDKLLAAPMPATTYEAFASILGWRSGDDLPTPVRAAMKKRRPGRPKVLTGNEYLRRNRARSRARSAAMTRLKHRHAAEYRQLYNEERQRESASTDKETA